MDSPAVSIKKGETYKSMGLLKEAIAEFETVLSDETWKYRATREIASCLVEMEQDEQAEKMLLQALCLAEVPEEARMWLLSDLADLYVTQKKYESALERLVQIENLDAAFFPELRKRIDQLYGKLDTSTLDESASNGSSETVSGSDDDGFEDSGLAEQALANQDPRRITPRVKISNPVQYSFDQSIWATGYARDISIGGIFVLTYEPVPIGGLVFLKFGLSGPEGHVELSIVGQAVREEKGFKARQGVVGMGVEFISMEQSVREDLKRFIKDQLEHELPVTPESTELRFHCDRCGTILSAGPQLSGKTVKCECGESIEVPYSTYSPSKANPLRGLTVAGCRIDREIGRGSAAVVYKGHHLTLDIPVAIKVLHSHQKKAQSQTVKRFLKEARVVARLNHGNIVTVMDAGEEEDISFIVMQYVPGSSMDQLLRNQVEVSVDDAIRVYLDMCKALRYAHQHGVIHRDIKPANILLTRGGRALLTDFGMVKDLKTQTEVREKVLAVGTPLYIAPEQARGQEATDFRSDIYSLGATMYHLLSGTPPFSGSTVREVINKHIQERLVPLIRKAQRVPKLLSDIVSKSMMKLPIYRYQSADELMQALVKLSENRATAKFRPIDKKLKARLRRRKK